MRFIDFFSGIGGFRLGMEKAGHVCVGHCEIDKYANKSYIAMHNPKESEWYANDITRVKPEDVPEAECYCGGFPCQAFSIAGHRRGFEDTRGTLFFEVMRIAKERHPRYLFLENVKGLLNHEGGATFETIIGTMAELGYCVEWQVLNSKDFGVPQNRERLYIIGRFGKPSRRKVFPIIGDNEKTDESVEAEIKDSLHQVGQLYGTETEPNPQAGRVYSSEGISPCLDTCSGGNRMPKIAVAIAAIRGRSNGEWKDDEHFQVAELRHDGITNAITTVQKDNLAVIWHPGEKEYVNIRRLTPKECFRLQGFPDKCFDRAASCCSDSQLYKQAGNSVTVNAIYEIAKRLVE